jgi:predicted transcriptional regulator
MAEKIKFTEDEVAQINKLRIDVGAVFTELGQIHIERRRLSELEEREAELTKQHSDLVITEETLFKGLNEKYGDGDYNPTTGEFTPIAE